MIIEPKGKEVVDDASEKGLDEVIKKVVKAKLEDTGQENKAVAERCRSVKILNVEDIYEDHADEVLYLDKNSGSSSFEVEETDVGRALPTGLRLQPVFHYRNSVCYSFTLLYCVR
ncbi:hypothetical protein A2U01_0001209, partial [Trifolium medium]|nr:hypothetical protein [Trifolium medium]